MLDGGGIDAAVRCHRRARRVHDEARKEGNARNDGVLGPGAAKQVDLAGLQRRVLAYENGVSSLAKRVEEVKRHSELTWEWIRTSTICWTVR